MPDLHENDISGQIIDAAIAVHSKLGPGLLETVYEVVLAHELRKRGLTCERQQPVPIVYDNIHFDEGFRIDIFVEAKVIVELKSVEQVHPVHKKQVLTYLRLTNKRLGLLLNFGEEYLKDGLTRLVNRLPE